MAMNETKRLSQSILQQDTTSHATLKTINNYKPSNTEYEKDKGDALYANMQTAQTKEAQADAALKTARDESKKAEWSFHKYVLGVKDQVRAQFGSNSNELQAIGLKKRTEYKRAAKKV